jgi:hypothetical protein
VGQVSPPVGSDDQRARTPVFAPCAIRAGDDDVSAEAVAEAEHEHYRIFCYVAPEINATGVCVNLDGIMQVLY